MLVMKDSNEVIKKERLLIETSENESRDKESDNQILKDYSYFVLDSNNLRFSIRKSVVVLYLTPSAPGK